MTHFVLPCNYCVYNYVFTSLITDYELEDLLHVQDWQFLVLECYCKTQSVLAEEFSRSSLCQIVCAAQQKRKYVYHT